MSSPAPSSSPPTWLNEVPEWTFRPERGGLIERTFVFADFAQAFGFMSQVAVVAARRDHHPEWFNVYNRVRVVFTTHDAGGLTDKDREMAQCCDRAAADRLGPPDPFRG